MARSRRGRFRGRDGALCGFIARTVAGQDPGHDRYARHRLACNGRAVPLHPTGTNGEFVASAVRFRAWQPPGCLHPTIGVHATPVDCSGSSWTAWNNRSIGGYVSSPVSHAGGLSRNTLPVNAYTKPRACLTSPASSNSPHARSDKSFAALEKCQSRVPCSLLDLRCAPGGKWQKE